VLARAQLALAKTDLGRKAEALRHAMAAAESGRDFGQVLLMCQGLDALAHWHLQFGETAEALDCLGECASVASKTDNNIVCVYAGPRHAETLLRMGSVQEAAKVAQRTARMARTASSLHSKAVARRVLGQILAAQGAWDEAAVEFKAAIAALTDLESRLELGRALHYLGEMQTALGQRVGASTSFSQALSILEACHAAMDSERTRSALNRLETRD
jgi:tetratricopeptide (TPR) repeat protein